MKLLILATAIIQIFMLVPSAQAETLLPGSAGRIEDSAFENCSFESVVLPEWTQSLGDRAFADNARLKRIVIPTSVSSIAPSAFDGCPRDLLIVADGGYPISWAVSNLFDYSGGGNARILVTVETYKGDDSRQTLYGTATDGAGFSNMFAGFTRTAGNITLVEDPGREELLSMIPSVFAGAGETDISVFVFLGHGLRDADTGTSLLAAYRDTEGITASQLRAAFDGIGGRKVIIIDACYSGGLITDETETQSDETSLKAAEEFTRDFTLPFMFRSRSALTTDGYYIITACSANQQSYETFFSSGGESADAGFFSYYFNLGCGWDEVSHTSGSLFADRDQNGIVTLDEIAVYTSGHLPFLQTLTVYPAGADWFGLFRND
ncbi:MAG: caspase family protein [Clostridia bacterium]|nr:caspase family protein [Clostridia bacterium]